MRSENSLKNAKINLIFNLVVTFLGFVSRTIFVEYLGGTILGFNTLIVGIIGILNVAELGIGVAVNYELYKPLVDKDYKKINEIMVIFKRLYSYIGIGVFVLGLIFMPFLNHLTKGEVPYHKALLYFFILLVTTAGTYFFSYKQTLVNADQKSYIVQSALGISNIVKALVQIAVMVLLQSYLGWLIVGLIFSLGGNAYASYKVKKIYGKNISFKSEESTKVIMKKNGRLTKNILNMFFHKFGEIVIYQTDPIVIAAFANLKEIGIYANYTLIMNALNTILYSVFNGITASIGNLVASEPTEKIIRVFKEMRFMVNSIGIVICFSLFMTIDKFITIWLGKDYLFTTSMVLVLILNFYVQIIRSVVGNFKSSYGIYWDIWAPVAEGVINLIFSVGLAYKFGVIGVFIGTLISNVVIIVIWQPYTVYKYGFKVNPIKYYGWFLGNIVLYGGISVVLYYLIGKLDKMLFVNQGILDFLVTGIVSFVAMSLIVMILNFRNPSFKTLLVRIKGLVLRKI